MKKSYRVKREKDFQAIFKEGKSVANFREEGATMLAASIHLSRETPYIYISNYDEVELAEKIILKPYQTLAILVDLSL